ARRDLAGAEDRGRAAEGGAHPDPAAGAGGGRVHGPGQRLAAVPRLADHGPLVRGGSFLVAVAGAAAGAAECGAAVARGHGAGARRAPVRADPELLRARFRRPGAGPVAVHRAAAPEHLGRGVVAVLATVPRRR